LKGGDNGGVFEIIGKSLSDKKNSNQTLSGFLTLTGSRTVLDLPEVQNLREVTIVISRAIGRD